MYNNPYNNPYNNYYGQQNLNDRIDTQIAQLQQMKEQFKNQQPAINQTFQLAPNNHAMRYANTIDEVGKEMVYIDTPFFSKDMSVVWIKNVKGDIRTYELNEIKPLDEKDIQIEQLKDEKEELQGEIEKLRKEVKNYEYIANVDPRFDEQDTTKDDEPNGDATKNAKPSSIQRVSTSKKR